MWAGCKQLYPPVLGAGLGRAFVYLKEAQLGSSVGLEGSLQLLCRWLGHHASDLPVATSPELATSGLILYNLLQLPPLHKISEMDANL